ncbi:MAG: c-type cytochrome [Chloroflexi bacterium]|nr:c-type cytochrome [Chloroflexota bacterium]
MQMGYGRSRRMIGVMALAAVVAVIVAACGSDKEIPPTRTPSIPGTASATTAPSATATQAPRPTATSASAPTATQAPQPTATAAPAPIGDSSAGRNVFLTVGCTGCHTIDGLDGATGAIGPNLTTVGNRAGSRVVGLSAEAYLRQSVQEPGAFVVPGFGNLMPPNLASGQQNVDNLVAFLLTLR